MRKTKAYINPSACKQRRVKLIVFCNLVHGCTFVVEAIFLTAHTILIWFLIIRSSLPKYCNSNTNHIVTWIIEYLISSINCMILTC